MDNGRNITQIKEGMSVRLVRIEGGCSVRNRLNGMGFIKNVIIKVIHNSTTGPLILEVNYTRVAIGRGEAQKIIVME